MLPIFTSLLSVVPALLNTTLSIIRDKKPDLVSKNKEGEDISLENPTEFIDDNVSKGVSLSSKRILNIAGTGLIISLAISDLSKNGITKMNLILFAIGVAYSAGMALITYLSERK